jgi:hypothetical protein
MEEIMDLTQAVTAHQQWKMRLNLQLSGKGEEKLDPSLICRDDQCDLGRWIHSAGSKEHGTLPEFAGLKESHAEFHVCAGQVARKVIAGDKDAAKKLLDGPFQELTLRTVMAINRVRKILETKVA